MEITSFVRTAAEAANLFLVCLINYIWNCSDVWNFNKSPSELQEDILAVLKFYYGSFKNCITVSPCLSILVSSQILGKANVSRVK